MTDKARATLYLDANLLSDIKKVADYENRSLANYLECVVLGSEQLEDDLRRLRHAKSAA